MGIFVFVFSVNWAFVTTCILNKIMGARAELMGLIDEMQTNKYSCNTKII